MSGGDPVSAMGFEVTLATPLRPGAIAVLQWSGSGARDALCGLTGVTRWTQGEPRLCDLGGIDTGLAVLLDQRTAQVTPHGGVRVVERLLERLLALGGRLVPEPDPRSLFVEAKSPIEADAMAAIARAASPMAIDLLAAQPGLWLDLLAAEAPPCAAMNDEQRRGLLERSAVLDRLIEPPTVVVVGPPNAGKSTLTNRLLGEAASIVGDLPGTTRDWVGTRVELVGEAGPDHRVAVRWLDTPGLREASPDPIETRAMDAARRVAAEAEVLIAIRAADQPWPEADALPRPPELWLLSRGDEAAAQSAPCGNGWSPIAPLRVSAHTGEGLADLQLAVLHALGLADAHRPAPWCFSPALQRALGTPLLDLDAYLGLPPSPGRNPA